MGLGWHQLHSFILQTNRPTLEATVKASRESGCRAEKDDNGDGGGGGGGGGGVAHRCGRQPTPHRSRFRRRCSTTICFFSSFILRHYMRARRAYSIWSTFHVRALKECCGACSFAYLPGVSSLMVPGAMWHPQILANQLTLSQPGGQIMPT